MSSYIPRREFISNSTAALAAFSVLQSARSARAFPSRPDDEVIPWLDKRAPNPRPDAIQNQLNWEELDSWITPNNQFFSISHFDRPVIDAANWSLEIDGLVGNPMSLTLADIKSRPRQEVIFTVECSGNHGRPFVTGLIGNARWAGTPLASVLEEANVASDAIEVVFWGTDSGEVELKDEIRDVVMQQNFARSMSLEDAMNPNVLICYEMNGAALPAANGFPLRLIVPGWHGIANIKWLKRIELRDRRFMNLLMGRNYVTIREEVHNGETVWAETSVGRTNLKSAPAKVTRNEAGYLITGAAWGAPIEKVEVQIDDGAWQTAELDTSEEAEFAWTIWSMDWPEPTPGEHTVTSRAIDNSGQIQPAMDDPWITGKHTYWESNGQITRHVKIG